MTNTSLPETQSARRFAGVTGIAFVVAYGVLTSLAADRPGIDDSAAELRAYFTDHATLVHLLTWGGAAVTTFLLLPFAVGIRSALAATPRATQMWSRLMCAGAVVAVAVVNLGAVFWEAIVQGPVEQASDEVLQTLVRLDAVSFTVTLPWAFALLVAAGSLALVDAGWVSRRIGGLGVLSAVLQTAGGMWVFSEDPEGILAAAGMVGGFLMALWMLAVSITMLRDRTRTTAVVPDTSEGKREEYVG